nr:hypothetical protein [uncultured bacterium]
MTLRAPGFPEEQVRERAAHGPARVFPALPDYGTSLFGAVPDRGDLLDSARLVPPVFMPSRLAKLIELGREPMYDAVDLTSVIGGFGSPFPVYVSAFGSTQVSSDELGVAASRQAGRLGVPMVIGENIVPVNGYGRIESATEKSLLGRIRAYGDELASTGGGVVVQQSTEDADAEVWNLVYSDPAAQDLLDTGRLGLELKIGQGAKPGLGGMSVVDSSSGLGNQFLLDEVFGEDEVLRCASPGTVTEEILRQQIRLMRNNYPRARVWVKLPPARDVALAAEVAWEAGADAVTVDGAEGGTGWAPTGFLGHVGLPLAECLRRLGKPSSDLLVSGRMWEGTRAVKCLALGARAVGLGRAALLAVDTDQEHGLEKFLACLALELRLLISALGKYSADAVSAEDVWWGNRAS